MPHRHSRRSKKGPEGVANDASPPQDNPKPLRDVGLESARVQEGDDNATTGEQKRQRRLDQLLNKTQACFFHMGGRCRFGTDCSFAHSSTEMRQRPDLSKTLLCKAFFEGKCTDASCNFAHDQMELRTVAQATSQAVNRKNDARIKNQRKFNQGADASDWNSQADLQRLLSGLDFKEGQADVSPVFSHQQMRSHSQFSTEEFLPPPSRTWGGYSPGATTASGPSTQDSLLASFNLWSNIGQSQSDMPRKIYISDDVEVPMPSSLLQAGYAAQPRVTPEWQHEALQSEAHFPSSLEVADQLMSQVPYPAQPRFRAATLHSALHGSNQLPSRPDSGDQPNLQALSRLRETFAALWPDGNQPQHQDHQPMPPRGPTSWERRVDAQLQQAQQGAACSNQEKMQADLETLHETVAFLNSQCGRLQDQLDASKEVPSANAPSRSEGASSRAGQPPQVLPRFVVQEHSF